jgi:hypothetical protein
MTSKTRICFQMIVHNDDYVLEEVLKSILPYGRVIVTEGPVGYYCKKGLGTSTDRTNEILQDYVGEENIVHGVFPEKDQMVNAALHLVPPETSHLWEVDADEVWKCEDIEYVLENLEVHNYDSVSFHMKSFYGGFWRVMEGFESKFEVHRIQRWFPGARWTTHRPPTILSPEGIPWRKYRHWNADQTEAEGLFFYHYSYVYPSQMKKKSQYYASMGGTIPGYFDTVYRPWILGDETARACIESEFNGVHDWLPERRGSCRTVPFVGEHPREIQLSFDRLVERLEKEVRQLKEETLGRV